MPKNVSPFERALHFFERKVSRAIRDFELIQPGDRIMIALSGGKDSLALLHVLALRRAWRPEPYELLACHVRNSLDVAEGTAEALKETCDRLGIPFLAVEGETPTNQSLRESLSPCFLCARFRRKALFEIAKQEGCRTIAFGHHQDDFARTLLMNLFWHGKHESMLPKQPMFDLEIIRPLALIEEKDVVRLAKIGEFPIQPCRCPWGKESTREVAKQLIDLAKESGCRDATANLFKSLRNR